MMKLIDRLYLKHLLSRLEKQISGNCFDRVLSRRIDAVRFLLEVKN
jgi:hypothetical protein